MLSLAMKSVLDSVYITDLAGHFLFVNAAFERLYGYAPDSLPGKGVAMLEPESGANPLPADAGEGWVGEVVHRTQYGARMPVWLSRSALKDESGRASALVYVARDMTERQRLEETLRSANERLAQANEQLESSRRILEQLAIRDELTNLYNRRELDRLLDHEVARSARSQQPFTLLILDVDHFKRVNDAYGHLAGDAVLRRIGEVISETLRQVDRAARFGGEEFAVLLPDTPPAHGLSVAERIRERVAAAQTAIRKPDGATTSLSVTLSIGLAGWLPDSGRARDLIERADRALYRAKAQGRNRAVSADAPDGEMLGVATAATPGRDN